MKREILRKYFPIIKKHYPECKEDEIEVIDSGHDHFILLVKNLYAFRFPRTDGHGKNDHMENSFL
ncbi:MAG: hypothetical protein HYT09_00865, partial [Candidatus Levybacteria bacterium]|nr:hypothetical protein [Candidatus Levybacteria bacterium]